jgi:DNA-binding beta-propeller fold protein YncE
VWPAPPEEPRIRYVGQVRSESDLGRHEGFFSRLRRLLMGGDAPAYATIQRPFDVCATDSTRFYVTDGITPSVAVFDYHAKRARHLGADVPGGLSKPMGLGCGGDRIYVADAGARRVVVFDSSGRYLRAFGGAHVLLNPVDVAPDADRGRFYVVDSYLHQVVIFDSVGAVVGRLGRAVSPMIVRAGAAPRLAHGEMTPGGGEPAASGPTYVVGTHDAIENRGESEGSFRYPISAAVGVEGRVYVSDQLNFRVQAFDSTGRFLRTFGGLGDSPGSFARPKGVAVDRAGHVYVVDAAFNNVQVFDPDGALLLAFGAIGHGRGEHWLPLGITVDRRNRIYVADRYNNRAQVYDFLPVRAPGADR